MKIKKTQQPTVFKLLDIPNMDLLYYILNISKIISNTWEGWRQLLQQTLQNTSYQRNNNVVSTR